MRSKTCHLFYQCSYSVGCPSILYIFVLLCLRIVGMYSCGCSSECGFVSISMTMLGLCAYVCNHFMWTCKLLSVSLCTCVCKSVCMRMRCVSEMRRYSGGVWSLHLLRTSESVKSTDCPNRSHWDSNPRLSCAWATLERQEREWEMPVCVCVWFLMDEWWRRREEIRVSRWANVEQEGQGRRQTKPSWLCSVSRMKKCRN